MMKPRRTQIRDELWIHDYTEKKHNAGFAIYIAQLDGKVVVLHFNPAWNGENKYRKNLAKIVDFVPSLLNREELIKLPNAYLDSEL